MCFLEKEEGLVLSGIVGILKLSVQKNKHAMPLCLYIAEQNIAQ